MQLFSIDFFPPVLDDPGDYGAVAAANSLSDIYAMGGEAAVVLNLAGLPEDWGPEITAPLFRRAAGKVQEAGALWVGGHTVRSAEPLFGFAVFGEVAEDQLVTNRGAAPGDLLYLTKPLGAGSLTTGVKQRRARPEHVAAAADWMARLNRPAAVAMRAAGVKAATDVTGFGLFGHAANLARGSKVALAFKAVGLPIYEGAAELAAEGVLSGSSRRSRKNLAGLVETEGSAPPWLADLCYDAETSGGVLAAVPEAAQAAFLEAFSDGPAPFLVGEVQPSPPRVRLI